MLNVFIQNEMCVCVCVCVCVLFVEIKDYLEKYKSSPNKDSCFGNAEIAF